MADFRVRAALAADAPAIDGVHRAAFPADLEARLVALLTERGKAVVSLVAEEAEQVVGHILFSPATVGPISRTGPGSGNSLSLGGSGSARQAEPTGLGLAPVAVLPSFQHRGIGSALIRAGLAECLRLAAPWVVVLGHEAYYPRFGFAPASRWNLTCDYGVSDAFQFLPLTDAASATHGGRVSYAPEFAEIFPE